MENSTEKLGSYFMEHEPYNRDIFDKFISQLKTLDPKNIEDINGLFHAEFILNKDEIDRLLALKITEREKNKLRWYHLGKHNVNELFIQRMKPALQRENATFFNNAFDFASKTVAFYGIIDTFALWDLYFQHEFNLSIEKQEFKSEDYQRVKEAFIKLLSLPHLEIEKTWSLFSSFISKFKSDSYDAQVEELALVKDRYSFASLVSKECEIHEYNIAKTTDPFNDWFNYLRTLRKLYFKNKSQKPYIFSIIKALLERAMYQKYYKGFEGWNFNAFSTEIAKFLRSLCVKVPISVRDDVKLYHNQFLLKVCKLDEKCLLCWKNLLSYVNAIDYFNHIRTHLTKLLHSTWIEDPQWKDLAALLLIYEIKESKTSMNSTTILEYLYEDSLTLLEIALAKNDPAITLERLICDIFCQLGDLVEAQTVCKKLIEHFPEKQWAWLFVLDFEKNKAETPNVSAIYRQACDNVLKMEWPEPILNDWLLYEQNHGTEESLAAADRQCSKALELLWNERGRLIEENQEDEKAQAQLAQNQVAVDPQLEPVNNGLAGSKKRHLEDTAEVAKSSNKKPKIEQISGEKAGDAFSVSRDREHLCVRVHNLSEDVTEEDLKQYFEDSGRIRNVSIIEVSSQHQATIEFSSEAEVLAALTKTFKQLKGQEITIERVVNNTIFVTNFSPTETAESLKQEFSQFGHIVSVRFPSLKYNADRRFCYIEYLESNLALQAVEKFDNFQLRKDFPHTLSVKISNPQAKKTRSANATEDGREVYIRNLDFKKTTADMVEQLFRKYGSIQRVHLPLSFKSKSLGRKNEGYGFVTFETAEEACGSLELNMLNFQGRIIEVSIAEKKPQSEKKFKKVIQNFQFDNTSPTTVSHQGKSSKNLDGNTRTTTTTDDRKPNVEEIKNRIISILNLPDIINANQLLEYLSEKVGPVNKLDLRSISNSALVEFAKLEDAGKAGLILNGETLNDKVITVGTRAEFDKAQRRGNAKESGGVKGKKTGEKTKKQTLMAPAFFKRKKKVGGTKRAAGAASAAGEASNQSPDQGASAQKAPSTGKSNDDFRKLFLS